MDEKYYAHLSEDGRKQTMLRTALLCAQFAAKFGEKALGYWAGLLHDIGKFAKAFQKRLLLRWEKGGSVHVGRALPRVLDPGLHSVLL